VFIAVGGEGAETTMGCGTREEVNLEVEVPDAMIGSCDPDSLQRNPMTVSNAEETSARTRVLVVDDHYAVRRSLIRLLNQQADLRVCAAVASAERALDLAQRQPIDLAIVDISLRNMDGLELTRRLKRRHPHLRVLILSMSDPAVFGRRALDAGATGFLAKQEAGAAILTAIHQVIAGNTYISSPQDTIH
jgi:CheY-like chemotaxis protein